MSKFRFSGIFFYITITVGPQCILECILECILNGTQPAKETFFP
jgi:hypothetical protein